MSSNRRRPTLADVAGAAGVSKTAASLALNDKASSNVSAQTRRRILAAADELGFHPHAVARALSRRRAEVIGVVGKIDPFVHESQHLFEHGLLAAIFRRSLESGYNPLIYGFPEPQEDSFTLSRYADGRSDAFLLLNPPSDCRLLDFLHQSGIPSIALCFRDQHPTGRWVDSDHEAGVSAIVDHLVQLGHRRVGFFIGPVKEDNVQTRVRAFRSSMLTHGLSVSDDCVLPFSWDVEKTALRVHQMFGVPAPPTALLAWNDYAAEDLIRVLRSRGLDVPRDVSVVGFDDTAPARMADPPLTTVRQDLAKMGSAAVDLAVEALCKDGIESPRKSVLCGVEFIARGSTGPCREWIAP